MRVSCPNCSTQYDVPDAALAGRSRKLRCERCGNAWRTEGPVLSPTPPVKPLAPPWATAPARKPALPATPVTSSPIVKPPPPAPMPLYTPPPAPAVFQPAAAQATVYQPLAAAPPPLAASLPPVTLFPPPPVALVSPPAAPTTPAYEPPEPAWSPLPPDNLIQFPPPELRQFGKPVDDSAQAEVLQAVAQEQKWQTLSPAPTEPEPESPSETEASDLPAFLTAAGADETLMLTAPYATVGGDRFAELVFAARNKAIEVEPEKPPPPPPVRTSNTPLFISLVIAFIIAITLLEHAQIARAFPGTARFFAMLGLK